MKESVMDERHIVVTYCKRISKARVTTDQTGRCSLMREREYQLQLRK